MFSIKTRVIQYGKRILTGIKKGYSIPTLPNHIIEFTN